MSKDPKSPPRSRSRSASRSRSPSRSRSQSRSRSRSRKRHYSSRSRSRSHSRDRGYPREYQNNRGFRGYNRGFRRPYYYRGRNRGFYPRGRYQRGGGGGGGGYGGGGGGYGGGGYRPNYWHRGQEDQYEHHQYSPRRGRSRTRSRSRSRSRSRGSSSARSRRSYSSSSRSPSPPRRSGSGKHAGKGAKEAQRAGPKNGGDSDKQSGGWQGLTDYNTSPKRQTSPHVRSAVIVQQATPAAPYTAAAKAKNSSPTAGNSDAPWKSTGAVASTSKPSPPAGSAPSGFGFFSKEDVKAGDRSTLSSAFQKFLVEQREKKQASEPHQELNLTAEERGNSTTKSLFPIKGPAFQKGPPFLGADDNEQGTSAKPHGAKRKSKASLSTRDLYGQWEEPVSKPPVEGRGRREADSEDDMEEGPRRSRALGADPELSLARVRDKGRKEVTPPTKISGKRGEEFDFSVDPGSSSGFLAKERRISRDLADPGGKDEEFCSVFQHIQSSQLRRSPSELFAQHIVSIVHQIKAQHFQCSGITLSERFAMYQRRAPEEDMRSKKSPEIHRRIDISPSAFKKHSYLFEEMENCRGSGYKDPLKKTKDDLVDLQLEHKHRKKRSSKEHDHRWAGGRESGDSRGSSRERSAEKSSKRHKKSKKSKKKRERSRSSSIASPRSNRAGDYPGEEHMEEGFGKAPLGPRDHGGPMERGPARGGFARIGGRGWNKINFPGQNTGAMAAAGVPVHPPEEEWDPEFTPKSKKYFLHDVREGEKWLDGRGRGRGLALSGRGRFVPRGGSPKWVHDKFQGSREEGELQESEQDPEEGERKGGAPKQ